MTSSNGDQLHLPAVVREAGPARRLRDVAEPLAMHAVWARLPNDRLAANALDVLAGYVGGRGAWLGDPSHGSLVSSFAWFEPKMIVSTWQRALTILPREELVALRDAAVAESMWSVLDGDDPTEVADLLTKAATNADGKGRALFSGMRDAGAPLDPALRLWWACGLIREHRGDSHIVAANMAGLDALEMNILTELWIGMPLLSYTATRGWGRDDMQRALIRLETRGFVKDGILTELGLKTRRDIETATDEQERSIVAALDVELDAVLAQLDEWGQRAMTFNAFPVDVLKRAAG